MGKKKLSKTEIEERAEDLASKVLELEKLQEANKLKKKKLKDLETELEVEIAELAIEVKSGEEEVDDQVDAFEDGKKKKGRGLAAVKPPEEEEPEKH